MKVRYGELGDNIYGEYNQANPNTMLLNRMLLGGGIEEAAKLAAVMAHEGEHALGTRIEALAHDRGSMTYGTLAQMAAFNVDESFMMEMLMGMMLSENYAANTGDMDYWKLTREGGLEYDGFATLRDADGNILKSHSEMKDSNGKPISDNSIEGALLWLLNIDPDDSASVSALRDLMVKSGMKHSFDDDPENWMWRDEQDVLIKKKGSTPITEMMNLSQVNMGKTIGIKDINKLFSKIGTSGNETDNPINRIYGSAISFLNYADTGKNTKIANSMLLNYYDSTQCTNIVIT